MTLYCACYRALDNQLYATVIRPARDEKASYRAWGYAIHAGQSMVGCIHACMIMTNACTLHNPYNIYTCVIIRVITEYMGSFDTDPNYI